MTIAGPPEVMKTPAWRTHSCVPRSHSCERSGFDKEAFA